MFVALGRKPEFVEVRRITVRPLLGLLYVSMLCVALVELRQNLDQISWVLRGTSGPKNKFVWELPSSGWGCELLYGGKCGTIVAHTTHT